VACGPFKYPISRVQTRPKPSGFLRAESPQRAFLWGGGVKPSVPCRRFAACKRSLNVTWKSAFRQNYQILLSPVKFHLSLLGSLASRRTSRHLAATVGTSKTRGEQGSTTSLKAAVQPGHWLRALIYNNNNNTKVNIIL
jgi:hypothetical protein